MKQILFALCLLSISYSGFPQTGEKNFIDQNYIEVTGKAEMAIVPDLIYLEIVLSDKDNKNKYSLDQIDKIMIKKLNEIGIDLSKDLSVTDFNSEFKKYWLSADDIILTKQYQLIVHDANTLQSIFKELQKLGISQISIEKVDHSNIEQYRKEVKTNAIKAAKEKAEGLANAINQAIGKALYIQEVDFFSPYIATNTIQNNIRGAQNSFGQTLVDGNGPYIEFEKINLQYTILVRFELK